MVPQAQVVTNHNDVMPSNRSELTLGVSLLVPKIGLDSSSSDLV